MKELLYYVILAGGIAALSSTLVKGNNKINQMTHSWLDDFPWGFRWI
jgi:hypothetical protein